MRSRRPSHTVVGRDTQTNIRKPLQLALPRGLRQILSARSTRKTTNGLLRPDREDLGRRHFRAKYPAMARGERLEVVP